MKVYGFSAEVPKCDVLLLTMFPTSSAIQIWPTSHISIAEATYPRSAIPDYADLESFGHTGLQSLRQFLR